MSSGHKGQKHTNKHTDPLLLIPGGGCRCCRIIKAPMPQLLRQTTSFRASREPCKPCPMKGHTEAGELWTEPPFLPAAEMGLHMEGLQGDPSPDLEQGLSWDARHSQLVLQGAGPICHHAWGSHPCLQPGQNMVTQLDLPSPGISVGQGESPRREPTSVVALEPLQPLLGPDQGGTAAKNWVCSPLHWLQEMLPEGHLPARPRTQKNTSLHSLRDRAPVLTHQLEKHTCIGLSWLSVLASPCMASATQA